MNDSILDLNRKCQDNWNRFIVNEGENKLICCSYRYNICKIVSSVIFCITTGLIPLMLLFYIQKHLFVKFTCSICDNNDAHFIILKDVYGRYGVATCMNYFHDLSPPKMNNKRKSKEGLDTLLDKRITLFFDYRKTRYVFDGTDYKLLEMEPFMISDLNKKKPLSLTETNDGLFLFQRNILHIAQNNCFYIFFNEIFNTFYVFQLGSIILWSLDEYYYYASAIFIIVSISVILTLYETKMQKDKISKMCEQKEFFVDVMISNGDIVQKSAQTLVPGMIFYLPLNDYDMFCDAILLTGSVLVDESFLTGETLPVTKLAVNFHNNEIYNSTKHKINTVYAGTHVVQTRYYYKQKVKAMVVNTGFNTVKGSLIRSILYPKPLNKHYYNESVKFLAALSVFGLLGMIYSVVLLYKNKVDTATIFIRVLDIITIIVPPALPAAMTVGFVYAQKRLKRQKIFCNSPQYISFAGLIDLACFDKTGTLTENELSVTDVITLDNNGELLSTLTKIYSLQQNCSIRKCLATAHMLTEINGAISGDPLDIAMFRATGWTLEETKEDNEKYDDLIPVIVRSKSNDEYGIMRYLPFDSSIQMMSVITSAFDNQEIMLYSKGAPEKLVKLCTHIPNNFSEILERYTRIGFRVLALASRKLNLKWHSLIHINRSELEKNFKFEGLLLTINRLKDNVHVIIDTLEKSNILTVMSTGDNINTAICVAKQSHIICDPSNVVHISQNKHRELIVNFEYALEKHAKSNVLILLLDIFMHNYENLSFYGFDSTSSIVMNGNIFELLKTQHFIFLKRIIKLCKVFARMSPNDKTALIDTYQKCGLTVSMCGDGANDCGAMKIADIGISLSKSESCFAAPFTCTDSGIDCIVTLIKEGRCALVTSYGILKYMSFYSITQFTTVLILYSNNNNLTDGMFLYIDLIITSIATLFMSNTPAYNKIVTKKPYSILKIKTIMAMLMQIFLLVSFQILVFEYLKSQPWYINDNTDSRLLSYDNYILFVFSCFQYIIGVFTYSKGPPYRKRMWNNKTLTICLTILMGINVYFLSNGTSNWFTNWMQFKIVPSITFRHSLLAIAFVQFCASYMIEYVLD